MLKMETIFDSTAGIFHIEFHKMSRILVMAMARLQQSVAYGGGTLEHLRIGRGDGQVICR